MENMEEDSEDEYMTMVSIERPKEEEPEKIDPVKTKTI
jgi:hypothetical protein